MCNHYIVSLMTLRIFLVRLMLDKLKLWCCRPKAASVVVFLCLSTLSPFVVCVSLTCQVSDGLRLGLQ